MKFRLSKAFVACATGIVAIASLGLAQIERLDLAQMVAKTDNAIVGKIVASRVFRTDAPTQQLFFTTLTIQGQSLVNHQPLTVDVTFGGGFISPTEGVFNSEAPAADDVKVGNRVVVFYRHEDNMGNGVSGNAPYAWHGGVYRVFSSPQGAVVLGKGDGFALSHNYQLADLETQIVHFAGQKNR